MGLWIILTATSEKAANKLIKIHEGSTSFRNYKQLRALLSEIPHTVSEHNVFICLCSFFFFPLFLFSSFSFSYTRHSPFRIGKRPRSQFLGKMERIVKNSSSKRLTFFSSLFLFSLSLSLCSREQ